MKEITIRIPRGYVPPSAATVFPVMLDWFPPPSEAELIANANALIDGDEEPFPDPNLVSVKVVWVRGA
jgi:hypothetical protein